VRQTSYYSGLESEIDDSKERNRAGKMEPAGVVGGETDRQTDRTVYLCCC
jgi:hypothetical protein